MLQHITDFCFVINLFYCCADSALSRKRKRRVGVVSRPKLSRDHQNQRFITHLSSSDSLHRLHQTDEVSVINDIAVKMNPHIHIERHPNGNACVLHVYQNDIAALPPDEMAAVVQEFFNVVFSEDEAGQAHFVMGIVHNAVSNMPEMVRYLNSQHPHTLVKMQCLGNKSAMETTTVEEFAKKVEDTYYNNTFRCGGLDQFSLVGVVQEEVGDYFPDILDMIEENPFLKASLPWSDLSGLQITDRKESDDGPILWVRPGEQVLPLSEIPRSQLPKRRRLTKCNNVLN